MTIEEVIERRCIEEVVHFTSHTGLLGILHSGVVKSRKDLPSDLQLEYVYKPNAPFRKDLPWLGYVNLSISQINRHFFSFSYGKWHRSTDMWWCILAFDPMIMAHPGVYFSTTNNIYTGVKRGTGADGLELLFARQVLQYASKTAQRNASTPSCCPTCEQAEVLYPGDLSIDYLRRIYVMRDQDQDEVHAQLSLTNRENIEVKTDPTRFVVDGNPL